MQALKLTIYGKVQGVGYRRWFEKQALSLNLKGVVQNLATGEVEAVVIGHQDQINEMIQRSYNGPLFAEVEKIEQEDLAINSLSYHGFKMLR